ncbi:MAG: inorganic phosphate transporter [Pseudomonadales bacterium]|nr:inorganic phosphate transporter [Pseudomonadales bacterium]
MKLASKISHTQFELLRAGVVILFMLGVFFYVSSISAGLEGSYLLIVAALFGGYMALNIGANDVANNVGPAVGAQAISLGGAIMIAAIFEATGAIVAGGDVVSTIKKGIIDPNLIQNTQVFIWLMMAALLAGALWLNLATFLGAPVSTTHSIVGGVLGAGIAAGGMDIANWGKMGAIAASWVISPVLGGLIAALFLYLMKHTIFHKTNMLDSAKKMIPIFLAIMTCAFTTYLCLKGLKKVWKMDFQTAGIIGFVICIPVLFFTRSVIAKAAESMTNTRDEVGDLFTIPLICSAALLSFAHGANDVANAIGPLSAINDAVINSGISAKASIPLWVMIIGAIGIAIGLALYGPKLIRTVGTEITELDKPRAFCVAMAASITVIIASQLGLPVSSTHIAVGGVFGVGFLREYLKLNYLWQLHVYNDQLEDKDSKAITKLLRTHESASIDEINRMFKKLKKNRKKLNLKRKELSRVKKIYKVELVKRSALYKIAAAWVVTVPASAMLAALFYFMIRGFYIN